MGQVVTLGDLALSGSTGMVVVVPHVGHFDPHAAVSVDDLLHLFYFLSCDFSIILCLFFSKFLET